MFSKLIVWILRVNASCNSRDDADDGTFFYGCFFLLQVPDILIAYKNIKECADLTFFVEKVFFQVREMLCQLMDCLVDIG
jgi:hypothetical protein